VSTFSPFVVALSYQPSTLLKECLESSLFGSFETCRELLTSKSILESYEFARMSLDLFPWGFCISKAQFPL